MIHGKAIQSKPIGVDMAAFLDSCETLLDFYAGRRNDLFEQESQVRFEIEELIRQGREKEVRQRRMRSQRYDIEQMIVAYNQKLAILAETERIVYSHGTAAEGVPGRVIVEW